MGIFEAEIRRHTGEEDMLTSRVFGTLQIIDSTKFLAPILKQCGVELGDETDPGRLTFSYWETVGDTIPDVVLRDKSILIYVESKLNAPLNARQLVDEYEGGVKAHKNFWLIAVTKDWIEPSEIINKARQEIAKKHDNAQLRLKWINWQKIYEALDSNVDAANQTEQQLIKELCRVLEAKKLKAFSKFEIERLKHVASLYPEWAEFLKECSALFGTVSSRLHEKNITSTQLPRWTFFMRAWDSEWTERKPSQGLLIRIRFSPLELEAGYRLGLWQPNLKPMFIEAVQSRTLAEKLRTLSNCSVSYYSPGYELLERITGDSLDDEAFSAEGLENVKFLIIGRVFNREEMASPKLVEEVVQYLVNVRDIVNQNSLYFSKQAIESFIPPGPVEGIEELPIEEQPCEEEFEND